MAWHTNDINYFTRQPFSSQRILIITAMLLNIMFATKQTRENTPKAKKHKRNKLAIGKKNTQKL